MCHLEQNRVSQTENLVDEFSETGEMIIHLCSGTSVTAKPYLEVLRNCRFVGSKADAKCFKTRRDPQVEEYAGETWN